MADEKISLVFDGFDGFYASLLKYDVISTSLYKNVICMLAKICPSCFSGDGERLKMFLAVFFSFVEDGNICIKLDSVELMKRFNAKLDGELNDDSSRAIKGVFDVGVEFFGDKEKREGLCAVSGIVDDFGPEKETKPFVLYQRDGKPDFLYAAKYFRAKCDIERCVKKLFESGSAEKLKCDASEYNEKTVKSIASDQFFKLNKEQVEAIARAKNGESLFITGGAGTGKTTAVFYILYELIKEYQLSKDDKLSKDDIHIVAPSGKAADRLTESIGDSLKSIKDEEKNESVFKTISELKGSTIHSLLHYSPKINGFEYNRSNKIITNKENSVFVIDEASMVDILLFADLLNAIPEKAHVFILGDPNQLPSVEAGAVLGNLLDKKGDTSKKYAVHLVESKRFGDKSEVGGLAKAVIEETGKRFDIEGYKSKWVSFEKFSGGFGSKPDNYPVFCYDLKMDDGKGAEDVLEKYFKRFYESLYSGNAGCLTYKASDLKTVGKFEDVNGRFGKLFGLQEEARILTANRKGDTGCEGLNRKMANFARNAMKDGELDFNAADKYFPGCLAIITKNTKSLDLLNGDNGIIVRIENDGSGTGMNYLVLKKKSAVASNSSDFEYGKVSRIGDYMLYPLSAIPSEAIERSYAITIHKSQGSGYDNILIFLPDDENSPLLNRQILYTAITRTKGNTHIVVSIDNFVKAQKNSIERWTEIEL